jgi:ligand-binding sensor domain-containing protein
LDFDRFTHYKPDDWITYGYSNHITTIEADPFFIYFGTTHGGILRYNIIENQWYYPFTTSNGLSSNSIVRIITTNTGNQLTAFTDKGRDIYYKYLDYWKPDVNFSDDSNDPAFSPQNGFEPYSRPSIEKWPVLFPDGNYTFMPNGNFYDPDNEEYKISDKLVDDRNRLWFGSNGSGIGVIDLNSYSIEIIKQSVPAIIPKDVLVQSDDIWIGGSAFIQKTRGISYWDFYNDIWQYFKTGQDLNIFSDNINVIEGTGHFIFFGTDIGLLMFNRDTDKWYNLSNLFPITGDAITDLCQMGNLLFIATTNGVYSYDPFENFIFQIADNYIKQTKVNALTASDSLLFIGTNFGIFNYNPRNNQTAILRSRAAIPDNFIDAMVVDNHTLWFAGRNGIGFYDFKLDIWKSFPGLQFSLTSGVNHISATKGFIWFATEKGLLKYNSGHDSWFLYTTKDGLADNYINRIEPDGDYLWLATKKGVTLFRWFREGRFE